MKLSNVLKTRHTKFSLMRIRQSSRTEANFNTAFETFAAHCQNFNKLRWESKLRNARFLFILHPSKELCIANCFEHDISDNYISLVVCIEKRSEMFQKLVFCSGS